MFILMQNSLTLNWYVPEKRVEKKYCFQKSYEIFSKDELKKNIFPFKKILASVNK